MQQLKTFNVFGFVTATADRKISATAYAVTTDGGFISKGAVSVDVTKIPDPFEGTSEVAFAAEFTSPTEYALSIGQGYNGSELLTDPRIKRVIKDLLEGLAEEVFA